MLKNFLLIGIGGAAGSMLRYTAALIISNRNFPYSTFAVNIIGSFIIGIVMAFSLKNANFQNNWQLLLATGLCGGFTTFSAFTFENLQLMQNGRYLISILYISGSLIAGMLAVWLGYISIRN